MKSLENSKSKVLFNKILIVMVILLFVSNVYFYGVYKELKSNTNYSSRFSSAISIAANSNDMRFFLSKLAPYESDNLIEKFEEIKAKIGDQYNVKNYIAIEYKNGNTLIVKSTETKEGKYLIEDMFLLDEYIYEKIKDDTMYVD